jgi:hypothetical protein
LLFSENDEYDEPMSFQDEFDFSSPAFSPVKEKNPLEKYIVKICTFSYTLKQDNPEKAKIQFADYLRKLSDEIMAEVTYDVIGMRNEIEKLVDKTKRKTFTHPPADIQAGSIKASSTTIAMSVNGSERIAVKNIEHLEDIMLEAKSVPRLTKEKRDENLKQSE